MKTQPNPWITEFIFMLTLFSKISWFQIRRLGVEILTSIPNPDHGLSQQGVWVSFWTPKPLKTTSQDIQIFWEEFLEMSISSL